VLPPAASVPSVAGVVLIEGQLTRCIVRGPVLSRPFFVPAIPRRVRPETAAHYRGDGKAALTQAAAATRQDLLDALADAEF
jgi:hypothetical protein